ncbi:MULTISPECIES: DUF397 domain-containing protein [Streptomyces]|uniref:DUF397 domain-containing protein n=1 Tax=Streptomyces cacaoi TaxID=1898 RepID=A0A4Y3R503_STRCI|nr:MULTISPECIES: DUF397 domain-containing protein [Streptomyces]NNG87258.1 DUF397 domain-containing protein [Streptomyces cacaoi]QHF92785.1 DUF397 domain-containing protein [Streptomyces sp. NHF165]GEB52725.1 hypothetical protein SCA03_52760 [Streptomyces cacaoi]
MRSRGTTTAFRKSSYSGGGDSNECVEVAQTRAGGRAVRDSKQPRGGTAYFGSVAWQAFTRGLKS